MCEFPEGWQDIEILLQLIDKGRSRRIRRQLLSKEHTLQEALDFARSQEIAHSQAEKIEKGFKHQKYIPTTEDINKTDILYKKTDGKKK